MPTRSGLQNDFYEKRSLFCTLLSMFYSTTQLQTRLQNFTEVSVTTSSLVALLPPASEGWGKVIFSVCPHLQGGYPVPGLDGGTPSQVWTGGYPILLMGVTPIQDQDRGPRLDGVPPPLPNHETDQQSKHLLRVRRYASCVHAGGLSCFISFA